MEKQDGRRRRQQKIFQYCTEPSGQEILYFRAVQGHSVRNLIDPTLQDNALIPNNFFEYIYHIGCAVTVHSVTNSGLIAGGQNSRKDRHTVFFAAVNPMHKNHDELDLTKPRLASNKQMWKSAPRYGVLGRYTASSTERIEANVSPRPPAKISYKNNWMCDLDSLLEAARTPNESNQNP